MLRYWVPTSIRRHQLCARPTVGREKTSGPIFSAQVCPNPAIVLTASQCQIWPAISSAPYVPRAALAIWLFHQARGRIETMMKAFMDIWRIVRKVLAVVVYLFAFIHAGGFVRGLNYISDGGEFFDVAGVMIVSGLISAVLIVIGVIVWPGKAKLQTSHKSNPDAPDPA